MIDYEKIKQYKKVLVIIGIVAIIIILLYINYNKTKQNDTTIIDSVASFNNINENISEKNSVTEKIENICVHISGEVLNQGIVTLDANSRIIDAIEAAGGLTGNADISHVNLAFVISDGIKIHIPNINDEEKIKLEYLNTGSGENIVEDTNTLASTNMQKVNINTATKSELESLNGIGSSTSQKIIEYREMNGKFNSIDDIKNVSGIGNAKFESIKNYIIVK